MRWLKTGLICIVVYDHPDVSCSAQEVAVKAFAKWNEKSRQQRLKGIIMQLVIDNMRILLQIGGKIVPGQNDTLAPVVPLVPGQFSHCPGESAPMQTDVIMMPTVHAAWTLKLETESYLSLADVLNNEAHKTSMTQEQPTDKRTSRCSVVDIWNEAREATDTNLFRTTSTFNGTDVFLAQSSNLAPIYTM